ncbi:MAG: phosphatase PAP2 family protein [Oscillospiraceae bacterium]|nr:phosphatase PAP2 family protein [Oscillospiraceae bacterium]
MNQKRYDAICRYFRARPALLTLLRGCNQMCKVLIYAFYIGMCLFLLVTRDARLWRVLLVAAIIFWSGTALRAALNRPRPYEVMQIEPLIAREKRGKSFPSRHVFCSAAITMAAWYLTPAFGMVAAALTGLVSVCRVLGGIHWPQDVLFGLLYGGGLGWIGFFLLP